MCIESTHLFSESYDPWAHPTTCLLHAGQCIVHDHPLDRPAAKPAPCGAVVHNSATHKPANADEAHTSRTPVRLPDHPAAISVLPTQPQHVHVQSRTSSRSRKSKCSVSNLDRPRHSASCIVLDDGSECLLLQFQATRSITHHHARLKPTQAALL